MLTLPGKGIPLIPCECLLSRRMDVVVKNKAFALVALAVVLSAGLLFGGSPAVAAACFSSFINKTTADGLGANWVRGVYVEGSNVYAATESGLSISTNHGATYTNKTMADGLGANFVSGVYVDGSTVYAATYGGLSISTDGGANFANTTTADGLGDNIVLGVYADGSTVYAATYGGLSISTDGGATFSNKTMADGLGDNIVLDVYVDGSTVYAATYGGLSISADCVSPPTELPDTGSNSAVIGGFTAAATGLLSVGVIALIVVRRRHATR